MCLDNIIQAHAFYTRFFIYGLIYVSGNARSSLLSDNYKTSADISSSVQLCVNALFPCSYISNWYTFLI